MLKTLPCILVLVIISLTGLSQLNSNAQWVFMKGDSAVTGYPAYGIKGLASAANKPGARIGNICWKDKNGKLWIFGGRGLALGSPGTLFVNYSFLSDLWKYDPLTNEWTWVNGSSGQNQLAVFGQKGIPNINNRPGSRLNAACWTDTSGNLWMFGGYGHSASGTPGTLSDLWKYDMATDTWTWMSGNSTTDNFSSISGTKYVPAPNNRVGGRIGSASAVDKDNNLWLYGGVGGGIFNPGSQGLVSDLWKYNISSNQWTWMGGGEIAGMGASYGIRGVDSSINYAGAKRFSKMWFDDKGILWMYGGEGNNGAESDLWKHNTSTHIWTWMAGENIANTSPVYGIMGASAPSNKPGSRYTAAMIPDENYLFLFGGSLSNGTLNDMWRLDMTTFEWTWIKGTNNIYPLCNYGKKGVTHTNNRPGGREVEYAWKDNNGNIWMLGGTSRHLNGTSQNFPHDDLWKFNIISNNFTWMHGNNATECMGQFGYLNVPSSANKPGARNGASSWTDNDGNLWLFGGSGYAAALSAEKAQDNLTGNLGDLWKYEAAANKWVWMHGDDSVYRAGVYGDKGIFSAVNRPGGRYGSAATKGADGHFYLFGGFCNSRGGWMNDLWEFNPAINQWRWLSGDSLSNNARPGIYGTQGIADPANKPGARRDAAAWVDRDGNFWLFGGEGYASITSALDPLNDLWKFNRNTGQWTWMKGGNLVNRFSTTVPYATVGSSHINNTPGSRFFSTAFMDTSGNLWLYGGTGYSFSSGRFNELWKYDPLTNIWTWVKGTATENTNGIYGTQGIAAAVNLPGARSGAGGWYDQSGKFWMFGGLGNGETGAGSLNDLWKYDLSSNQWTWIKGDKTINLPGIYGTPGSNNPVNRIGGRSKAATWLDKTGNLWVFAGGSYGYAFSNNIDPLADLWKFGNYQPPTEICSGSNSALTANITGTNSRWQLSTDHTSFTDISDNTNYSGTATGTLQIMNAPAAWNGYQYRRKSDTDSSNIFSIYINAINASPTVIINVADTTFEQGDEIIFTASAQQAGFSPSYQWLVNGENTGTGADTLIVNNLSGINSVQVIVTTSLPCAASNTDSSNIITMTQVGRMAIQLSDKNQGTYSLQNPGMFLTARTIEKRAKFNIPIDSTDLPVNPAYLDSLRLAGNVSIIGVSKWFNKVYINSTDINAINKINSFSFVKNMTGVSGRTATSTDQNKFGKVTDSAADETTPLPELANIYNYGQSYGQVHLHQGEFLHNHGFSGQGMQLAILDAGFRNHETLPTFDSVRNKGHILGKWDFVTNAPLAPSTGATDSHGTHCFSTIAAHLPGSFVGTAPETSFYLYRTENAAEEHPIEELNLAAALERADSLGVEVASISLGYTTFDDPQLNHTYADMNGNTTVAAKAADLAAKKGMLVVVANGNEGTGSWHYLSTPADADSVLAVGAVNTSGVVGGFSSYGPSSDGQVKPGVAAVGVNAVVANAATGNPAFSNGTSFACPNMAGLSTCLWQAFPESNNMGIISALQESASIYNTPNNRIGYGIPNMKKAFVILLKRSYSQQIQQAGCNTLIKWSAKSSGNMNFVIERKLPTDADYVALQTINGAGSFANDTFNFADNLAAFTTPINISYRIKMNIDTDTAFYFTPVSISHQNACQTYTFTGNGSWTDASNWTGNNAPPAILPAGSSIVIDPLSTGECILNTTQQIQAGGYIEVRTGKKMRVVGNLIIQ